MDAIHAECRNCHNNLNKDDKFCSKCGQNTDTHKINLHYVIHELIHGILHLDGGIIYTTKALFTKPGIMIREYLEGKRKNHFSPIIYIVILSTMMALTLHYLYNDNILNATTIFQIEKYNTTQKLILDYWTKIVEKIFKNLTLLHLLNIPLLSIGFYIAFKKMTQYSFFEWLVVFSFYMIQIMIINIIFLIVNKIIPGIIFISNVFYYGIFIWTIFQLLSKYEIGKVIVNFILSLTINFFIIFIILFSTAVYFLNSNPNII